VNICVTNNSLSLLPKLVKCSNNSVGILNTVILSRKKIYGGHYSRWPPFSIVVIAVRINVRNEQHICLSNTSQIKKWQHSKLLATCSKEVDGFKLWFRLKWLLQELQTPFFVQHMSIVMHTRRAHQITAVSLLPCTYFNNVYMTVVETMCLWPILTMICLMWTLNPGAMWEKGILQKTKRVFSAIPFDQNHEQNIAHVKGDGGAVSRPHKWPKCFVTVDGIRATGCKNHRGI